MPHPRGTTAPPISISMPLKPTPSPPSFLGSTLAPVVATAVGGIPEQIKEGQTGFLVLPNAPEALTRAIQTLLDDDALRTRMGQTAASVAKQDFGLERQVDQFLAWYDDSLTGKRAIKPLPLICHSERNEESRPANTRFRQKAQKLRFWAL